ncbi:MAG: DUF4884 domain-containing protein [Bacteroidales bacterium]|nr:DUF4884 domain-containing protein [Tenuifilaceae bacterium]
MRLTIKPLTLILVFTVFSSCAIQVPISKTPPANNTTYNVEYLFEHDGCKAYRFRDNGHYVYFTNCKGDVTSIENDSLQKQIVNHIR